MTLTEQEKIQRAEEIYYRRNGINYRTERPQTVLEPKSHPIRNFLIIIMIIGVGFAYSNKDMLTSPEFQEKVKIFLNTKINIKDIFSLKQIKQENKTNDIKPAEQQSIQPTVEQLAENTGIENNEVIDNIEELEASCDNPYSMVIYFVKPGDTLWNIAKRFRSTVANIATINAIEDENKINVGEQLFIPI